MESKRYTQYLSEIIIGGVILILGAVHAFADTQTRPATLEEQAFHRSVLQVFADALPDAAPEGWEITRQTTVRDLTRVIEDAELRPLTVEYHLEWKDANRQRQAEERAVTRITAAASSPVSDEQLREYERLAAQIGEAAAAGDRATMQRLQQEMEKNAAMLSRSFEAMDEKIARITREESPQDSHVHIRLLGNRLYQALNPAAERITVMGHPAFRTNGYSSSDGTWNEGSTFVFLGDRWFPPAGENAYQFANAEGASHMQLQAIVVWIEADRQRAENLIARIDWQALSEAVGR